MPKKLTEEVINAAIDGFERRKLQIDGLIAELRTLLNGGSPQAAVEPEAAQRRHRKMSAAARRKIAEAQRARWAKARGESTPLKVAKPKRRISPGGLKRIIAATKKRWRLQRAAAKAKSA